MPIPVVTSITDLQAALAGLAPAFVPTMGALHAGHSALIGKACETARGSASTSAAAAGKVVVSIFINPTQFGPGEDFLRYPRQLDKDRALCEAAGADFVFAPSVHEVYAKDQDAVAEGFIMPALPAVATQPQLEDAFRPTHFAGVCKVVARLFDIVRPSHAFFGEKDYQQLRVITEMVREQNHAARRARSPAPDANSVPAGRPFAPSHQRWPSLDIIPVPTMRDEDGLALSSRNVYLAPEQRIAALALSRALNEARQEPSPAAAEAALRRVLEAERVAVDYAVVRDAMTLMPVEDYQQPCRALIAARIGGDGGNGGAGVRLIDNMAVGPASRGEA